jgi:hypothetical protein
VLSTSLILLQLRTIYAETGCFSPSPVKVRGFEEQCGLLRQYGMKHTRAFANMCNAGIGAEAMRKAASKACTTATPAF